MRFNFAIIAILVACNEATGVKEIQNSLPEIVIQSHSNDALIPEGELTDFYAFAADLNHELDELLVGWYANDALLCDWKPPEPGGISRCNAALTPDVSMISVQIVDPEQGGGRDEITVMVDPTQAPTATLISPLATQAYYSDQLISFRASLADAEDDVGDLLATWSSSISGDLPLNVTPDSNGEIEDYMTLPPGQHAISLRVEDSTGKFSSESVVITVGSENNLPTCDISSPSFGESFILGESVLFSAMVSDADISPNSLSVEWVSDKDGVLGVSSPASSGEVYFTASNLSSGDHTIMMNVADEVGGICSAVVLVTLGTPPSIQLDSPLNSEVYSTGQSVVFQGNITDVDNIPTEVSMSWVSDIDGEFSTLGADSFGSFQFAYADLSPGMHFITALATDPQGLTGSASVSLRVNTPPEINTISLSPSTPMTSDSLMASASGFDFDLDPVNLSYQWYKNGQLTSNSLNAISANDTSKGEIWTVRVTPNDGFVDGLAAEASVEIQNTPPSISAVSVNPSLASAIDVLTCSVVATDLDNDVLTTTLIWTKQSDGALLGTGSTLDLSQHSVSTGDLIACTATVEDSSGDSTTEFETALISNAAPIFSSLTLSPALPNPSDTVECIAVASDPDGDPVSLEYAWTNVATGMVMASGSTIDLSLYNLVDGDQIECHATASDPYAAMVVDSVQATIQNGAPQITGIEIQVSSDYNDALLTCVATAIDPENDPISIDYQWSNLTTGQSLGVGSTLQLDSSVAMPTNEIQCTALVEDSYGAQGVDQLTHLIDNRAPNTPTVSLSTSSPVELVDDIVCSISGGDDPDGQPVTVSISWTQDGVLWTPTSLGPQTVPASETSIGEVWECSASSTDGQATSGIASAQAIVSPPFDTHVFTSCDATGRNGPDQSLCDADYNGSPVSVNVSAGIQYWVVPLTGTYRIEAWGAQGGDGGDSGGLGARMRGDFDLIAGEVLKLLVGQRGVNSGNNDHSGYSAGGGGGSFVVTDADSPLLIAGGGGGAGVEDTCNGNTAWYVPGIGGAVGEDGLFGAGNACSNVGYAGNGGTGDSCSNGSSPGGGFYTDAQDYSGYGQGGHAFVNGGDGGVQLSIGNDGGFGGGGAGCYGGGGGGGYSGGGTGHYNNPCRDSGGGGGGSYNDGLNPDNSPAVNAGAGLIVIDLL